MHSVTSSYMVSHHHTYPVLYGKYTRAHVTSPYIVSHHHTHCHIIIHSQFCMVNILGYGKYTRGTDFHELFGAKNSSTFSPRAPSPSPRPALPRFFFLYFYSHGFFCLYFWPVAQGLDRPRPGQHYHGFFFCPFFLFFPNCNSICCMTLATRDFWKKKLLFFFITFGRNLP